MRLPFDFNNSGIGGDDARIKFVYTSPELNQNIEISMDGDKTSVEALVDAFERFLGALGISIPENVMLGFVEIQKEDDEDDDDDKEGGGTIKFTLDDDEDDDEDDEKE